MNIDDPSWAQFFDAIARERDRFHAAVTHSPDAAGSAALALSRPLRWIAYNGFTDEIEVAVGRGLNDVSDGAVLRYFLSAPRVVRVEERHDAKLIHIEDGGGLRAMIHLFDRGPRTQQPRDACSGKYDHGAD